MLKRFLACLLALTSPMALAYWEQIPGEATAIAIGANGSVWTIGTIRESGGYGVYRWDGVQFEKAPGISGVRIAVDPRGNPWVVDSFNNVRRWNRGAWENLPGWGKDVAIGADGSVWSVGLEGGLWRFRGQRFEKVYPGGFQRIAVAPDGEPWAVDEKLQVVRRGEWGWQPLRPSTRSIGIGAEGSVWIVDNESRVQMLDASGGWLRQDGRFNEIAVGPDGRAWAVTADNRIFRQIPGD
jgi:hypothetical protein